MMGITGRSDASFITRIHRLRIKTYDLKYALNSFEFLHEGFEVTRIVNV